MDRQSPQQKTPPDTQTETDTQNNTGDLRKITITEQVRGYHWAPAYLPSPWATSPRRGLTAEFQTIRGSDATAPVLSGDAQFTLKGIETALMVNEGGQGCKVVLSTTQKYPLPAHRRHRGVQHLGVPGRRPAGRGPEHQQRPLFLRPGLHQLQPGLEGKVEISTMASSGYAAAIANGELQGAISTNPWSAKQLTDAGGVVIVDGTDDGVIEDIIGSASYELFTVITSDALIESDPELVQSAVNAMAKAIQWMQTATPEEIAAQLGTLFDGATEEELLYDAQFDKDHQVATTDGYHTDSGFQAAINLTKLAGGITGDPTADQIFDESFLDKAWENLGQ